MTAVTFAGTTWMLDAACAGIPDFTEAEIVDQRRICARCPVQAQCLGYALEQDLPNPTYTTSYAGLSPVQLVQVAHGQEPIGGKVRERVIRTGPVAKTCQQCGRDFGAGNTLAKYCSRTCGTRAYLARHGLA